MPHTCGITSDKFNAVVKWCRSCFYELDSTYYAILAAYLVILRECQAFTYLGWALVMEM